MLCAVCGHENGATARFCEACGGSLTGGSEERRKVVSVLFCDVVGSTSLGESTDPEALRALLARYFEVMRGIVEWHEGTVEKFIGDAVMAVFGVPVVHEDDALRACRAAVEMREAFAGLGIEGRIGVCTGEVVTGTVERLATGDALNVAARLQSAAAPGEVLIALETRLQAGTAVEVESVEPLVLKGKSEPVVAFRLVAAREAAERPHDSVFVGRARELELLSGAWARAIEESRCELVTVVGDPGIGKSRLAAEALASIGARVVRGRCLPYGAGITYWPVVEVLKQLGALPSDPAAASAIRSLLGESDAGASAEEIAWAFRKLLEEQAPLVVVFDDIQWGEETFLDLIEHLTLLSAGAPLLLLSMARPELLDRRPAWPVTARLEPLTGEDTASLIGAGLPEELRARIEAAAAGNPLFIHEMVAMADEDGGEIEVPATLKALLAARLDRLDPAERRVLERGSVEGEVFHRGAVQALAPEEAQLTPRLAALVRRQLIRSDRTQFVGDDGFRFRHLLIRDTAYDALPKSVRADLHQRFADWLEHHADLIEQDEIVGYHLEQAALYKHELGQPDPALAERAASRLVAAGQRASWRGDDLASLGLYERALELTRPLRLDVVLEVHYAVARFFRDGPVVAAAIVEAAAERANAVGDEAGELVARAEVAGYRLMFEPVPNVDELETLARRAIPLLEESDDHAALAVVWIDLGSVANLQGCFEDAAHAAEEALRHNALAGRQSSTLLGLEHALVFGPRPADAALRTLDGLLGEDHKPVVLLRRAELLTMLGHDEEADRTAGEAAERLRELNRGDWAACYLAHIAIVAGRHDDAAAGLRQVCDALEARAERAVLSSYAPLLGRVLCKLGRYDEAEPLARIGRELGGAEDALTQALCRQVEALVLSSRGLHDEAERLAREAFAITERTDALTWHGDALTDLAEVLHAAGRSDDAEAAFSQALERYERKLNLAQAAQTRDRLAELQGAAPE